MLFCPEFSLFFNIRLKKSDSVCEPDVPFTQACLASQMTSCIDGTAPSTPPGTNPKSEMAKAFAGCATNPATDASVGAMLSALLVGVLQEGRAPWPKPMLSRTPRLLGPPTPNFLPRRQTEPCPLNQPVRGMCAPFFGVRSPAAPRIACRVHGHACCPRHFAATSPNRAQRRSNALELHLHGRLLLQLTPAPNLCALTPLLFNCEQTGGRANEVGGGGVSEGRGRIWRCGLKEN